MTVAHQHSRILVTALAGNFRHSQPQLEEPTDCLMPDVMETEVPTVQPCSCPHPPPGTFGRFFAHGKQSPIMARLFNQLREDDDCSLGENDGSCLVVLARRHV